MGEQEEELFTVNVFRVSPILEQEDNGDSKADGHQTNPIGQMKHIEEFTNTVSARIIKGRILELEHSKLDQENVKFRTVVNYEKDLEAGTYLGITFKHQEGYLGA